MKLKLLILALAAALAFPALASADFRTGNHWMVAPKAAASIIHNRGQRFRGGPVTSWATVNYVHCTGDSGPAYDVNRGRGLYHHLWCAASLYGQAHVFVTFDVWWLGQNNWRVTSIAFPSYS
jgi:hypothetical protein